MTVTDDMHIEPEQSSREYGGYRRIGGAHVYSGWIGVEWRADFKVFGVRDGKLLVMYEGGMRHGMAHGTGFRAEPCIWVSAEAFSAVEVYVRFAPQ